MRVTVNITITDNNADNLVDLESVWGQPIAKGDIVRQRLHDIAVAVFEDDKKIFDNDISNRSWPDFSIAGWAIRQAGKEGYDLDRRLGAIGAATVLLGVEGSKLFFLDTETARERLRAYL